MNDGAEIIEDVLLDANVLAESAVSDLILRIAESIGSFRPRWTREILVETHRTLTGKLRWPRTIVDGRIEAATTAFPESMIAGYEHWIPDCRNDPEDRHVLAAAIHAELQTIVTLNHRHFRPESLSPWSGRVLDPAEFLIEQFQSESVKVNNILEEMAQQRNRTFPGMLSRLSATIPTFTRHVANSAGIEVPVYGPKQPGLS